MTTTTTGAGTIDTEATLADLVNADIRRARVLEQFGLDYCCNGDRRLTDAAALAGVDLVDVARALDLAPDDTKPEGHGPAPSDLATLAHGIVDDHHAYLWEEMPRLHALAEKVANVHGERHPELSRVRDLYLDAERGLEPHLTREERIVFPAISRLERGGQGAMTSQGRLDELVVTLTDEHDVIGDIFKELREITGGYQVPADGCQSYRALYDGLAEMERDLHLHIHKENNVLFPATLKKVAEA